MSLRAAARRAVEADAFAGERLHGRPRRRAGSGPARRRPRARGDPCTSRSVAKPQRSLRPSKWREGPELEIAPDVGEGLLDRHLRQVPDRDVALQPREPEVRGDRRSATGRPWRWWACPAPRPAPPAPSRAPVPSSPRASPWPRCTGPSSSPPALFLDVMSTLLLAEERGDYCPLGKASIHSCVSSATDWTPTLLVMAVRWSFTVRSWMPRSAAICLFS